MIIYEPECATEAIENAIRMASLYTSGSAFQYEDGTLALSPERQFTFANQQVTSWVPKTDGSIWWSLDNPNLV